MRASETATEKRSSAVSLIGLHRRFGDIVAVERLNLHIEDGEFFSLIGPSGCGKTTTLRIVAGLEEPTEGRILVHGRDVTGVPAHRRPVNTVFQHYALFPHLDVFENAAFGLRERRLPHREIEPKVRGMLELVGLSGRERARPRELSGGQQQRVALARALVLEPEVLLLDEPLGALDLKLRKAMQALLKEIQREVGITFLYVTHDQEEAFSMSTRVGVMNRGNLEQLGTPKDVYQRPATLFVADFVGASNRLDAVISQQSSPDAYLVALTCNGAPLVSPGPVGLRAQTSAALVIRPEAIALKPLGGDAFTVTGAVTEVLYSGAHTVYTVDTGPLGVLEVATSGDDNRDLAVGDATPVSWTPAGSWLVPVDAVVPGTSS
jgi:spermidine/putrescine transport system ATP-binding protein